MPRYAALYDGLRQLQAHKYEVQNSYEQCRAWNFSPGTIWGVAGKNERHKEEFFHTRARPKSTTWLTPRCALRAAMLARAGASLRPRTTCHDDGRPEELAARQARIPARKDAQYVAERTARYRPNIARDREHDTVAVAVASRRRRRR